MSVNGFNAKFAKEVEEVLRSGSEYKGRSKAAIEQAKRLNQPVSRGRSYDVKPCGSDIKELKQGKSKLRAGLQN